MITKVLQTWESAYVRFVSLNHGEASGNACSPGRENVRNQAQALTEQEDGFRSLLRSLKDNIANIIELDKAGRFS